MRHSPAPTREYFMQVASGLADEIQNLQGSGPRIAILGNFNVGKSTLLNAVLHEKLVPTSQVPTTAKAIRMVHGQEPRTIVRMHNGQYEIGSGTALLDRFAVESGAALGKGADITVEIPSELLEGGRMIVDLPGLENEDKDYATVFREVALADIVLSVHDVRNQITSTELDLLKVFVECGVKSISFVLNFCNVLEPEEVERSLQGAVARLKEVEAQPLYPMRMWYRIDAKAELTQGPTRRFNSFIDDLIACNEDRGTFEASRAQRAAAFLSAFSPGEHEKANTFRGPTGSNTEHSSVPPQQGRKYLVGEQIGVPWLGHCVSDMSGVGITSLAFSPDGTMVVSAGSDRSMRMWRVETGQTLWEVKGAHAYPYPCAAMALAFSPDGKSIVSGGKDNMVRLRDAQSGAQIGEAWKGHTNIVHSVDFSPDGSRVVSAGWDKTIRLWDAWTGHQVGSPWQGHESDINSVAYSPDGTRIASVGLYDKLLFLWDAKSGRLIEAQDMLARREYGGGAFSLCFSRDGSRIAVGRRGGKILIYDVGSSLRLRHTLPEQDGQPMWVEFSPDGNRLIAGYWGGGIRLWDVNFARQIGETWQGHEGNVWPVRFSPSGDVVVSGGEDNTLRLWKV